MLNYNIISIEEFKEYQPAWSSNFEDTQIQDAINTSINDLNAFTKLLLQKVYDFNTGSERKEGDRLYRNDDEMLALKQACLSQTYFRLMNGNDTSIGDQSYAGAGISLSQSNPERNYIGNDVYQWLVNARLVIVDTHKEFIDKKCYHPFFDSNPDPKYVKSFNPDNRNAILKTDSLGYVYFDNSNSDFDPSSIKVDLDKTLKDFINSDVNKLVSKEYVDNIDGELQTVIEDINNIQINIGNIEDSVEILVNKTNGLDTRLTTVEEEIANIPGVDPNIKCGYKDLTGGIDTLVVYSNQEDIFPNNDQMRNSIHWEVVKNYNGEYLLKVKYVWFAEFRDITIKDKKINFNKRINTTNLLNIIKEAYTNDNIVIGDFIRYIPMSDTLYTQVGEQLTVGPLYCSVDVAYTPYNSNDTNIDCSFQTAEEPVGDIKLATSLTSGELIFKITF